MQHDSLKLRSCSLIHIPAGDLVGQVDYKWHLWNSYAGLQGLKYCVFEN